MTAAAQAVPRVRPVIAVEGITLPTISATIKGSTFTGYVNAYITGKQSARTVYGSYKFPLWYLSMVFPKGHGSTAMAITNSLFTNNELAVYIEGVGPVVLGNRLQDLQSLGWNIHWTAHQESVGGEAIQCILESPQLTSFDPTQREASLRKRSERADKGKNSVGVGKGSDAKGKASKKKESEVQTTAPTTGGLRDNTSEEVNMACRPMFLMLVPGAHATDAAYQEQMYATYLEKRLPFPLLPEWSPLLWQRALEARENEDLHVWSYTYTPRVSDEAITVQIEGQQQPLPSQEQPVSSLVPTTPAEPPYTPVISAAYLCRPDITKVHASIVEHLRKTIVLPSSESGNEDEKEKVEVEVAA